MTSRSSGRTLYHMWPMEFTPTDGWCDLCQLPSLVRLVYAVEQDDTPLYVINPVVCDNCGIRYE